MLLFTPSFRPAWGANLCASVRRLLGPAALAGLAAAPALAQTPTIYTRTPARNALNAPRTGPVTVTSNVKAPTPS